MFIKNQVIEQAIRAQFTPNNPDKPIRVEEIQILDDGRVQADVYFNGGPAPNDCILAIDSISLDLLCF